MDGIETAEGERVEKKKCRRKIECAEEVLEEDIGWRRGDGVRESGEDEVLEEDGVCRRDARERESGRRRYWRERDQIMAKCWRKKVWMEERCNRRVEERCKDAAGKSID